MVSCCTALLVFHLNVHETHTVTDLLGCQVVFQVLGGRNLTLDHKAYYMQQWHMTH